LHLSPVAWSDGQARYRRAAGYLAIVWKTTIQLDRLIEGKRYLEGILGAPVTTFMPPWNRYDRNTLKALSDLVDWLHNQADVRIITIRQVAGLLCA
jgi:peptidoglycan/xylan/chitin deacetylase (PgdA/CDA1 family)